MIRGRERGEYVLNGKHIYNPKSVADAVRRGRIKSYWQPFREGLEKEA